MILDTKLENKLRNEEKLRQKEYCCECEKLVEYHLELKKDIEVDIRGEMIKTTEIFQVCNVCGEELFNNRLENKNLKRQFNLYLKQRGFMLPQELKRIQKNMGKDLFKYVDEKSFNWQIKGSPMNTKSYLKLKENLQ